MQLKLYKTLWGHTGGYAEAADQAVRAGFDGLEGPMPECVERQSEFIEVLKSRGLEYVAEISATGFAVPEPGASPQQQLDVFERNLASSLEASPRICTTMAGSDLWSFAESVDFFTQAWELTQRYGVRVGFESHRSRSLYHPVRTVELLAELPPIELTLDLSHWCAVCERLVLDQLPDVLALCAERVLHIHGRIGYDQGAQVPDPRASIFHKELEAHLRWWRLLWEGQRQRGFQSVTMTPEFGPDGYAPRDLQTGTELVDLWALNRWMGALLRSEWTGADWSD